MKWRNGVMYSNQAIKWSSNRALQPANQPQSTSHTQLRDPSSSFLGRFRSRLLRGRRRFLGGGRDFLRGRAAGDRVRARQRERPE